MLRHLTKTMCDASPQSICRAERNPEPKSTRSVTSRSATWQSLHLSSSPRNVLAQSWLQHARRVTKTRDEFMEAQDRSGEGADVPLQTLDYSPIVTTIQFIFYSPEICLLGFYLFRRNQFLALDLLQRTLRQLTLAFFQWDICMDMQNEFQTNVFPPGFLPTSAEFIASRMLDSLLVVLFEWCLILLHRNFRPLPPPSRKKTSKCPRRHDHCKISPRIICSRNCRGTLRPRNIPERQTISKELHLKFVAF